MNSRRFCERNAEETIHAPVRCANERRGIHLSLGMLDGSYVWWSGAAEPKLWYAKVAYPGYGKDPQEDQRSTDWQNCFNFQIARG
jgi:hypothetical protein